MPRFAWFSALCAILALSAQDAPREPRLVNEIRTGAGVNPSESLVLNGMLEEAYASSPKLSLITRRALKVKWAREDRVLPPTCTDTACLAKAAQCKGVDAELTRQNLATALTVKLLSVDGDVLRTKKFSDIDLDDFQQMRALVAALVGYLEEGTEFDESKFLRKSTTSAAAAAPPSSDNSDLLINLSAQQVRQFGLEGVEIPVQVNGALRMVRVDKARLIFMRLPSGKCQVAIDYLRNEFRLTYTNRDIFLSRNVTMKIPEDGVSEVTFAASQTRGEITITANLPGVPIFLGGQKVGVTPSWKGYAEIGAARLRLGSPNVVAVETNLTVTAKPQSVAFTLSRQNTLRVNVHNSALKEPVLAKIFLDQKLLVEAAEWKGPVVEGEHELRVEHEGYEPATERFRLSDAPIERSIDLASLHAWLSVSIGPVPCTITLGRRSLPATTNLFLAGLPGGATRIRIEHPDYATVEETITLTNNRIFRKHYLLALSDQYLKNQRIAMLTGERQRIQEKHRKAATGLVAKFATAAALALTGTLFNLAADNTYAKAKTDYATYSAAVITANAVRSRESITSSLSSFDTLSTVGDSAFLLGSAFLIWGSFDLGSFRFTGVKIKELDQQIKTARLQIAPALGPQGVSVCLQTKF